MDLFGEVLPIHPVRQKTARRNLRQAMDLVRAQQHEQSIPYFLRATEDYNNVEEVVQSALCFEDKCLALELLESTEEIARATLSKSLGSDCFEDTFYAYGEFWGLMGPRTYMRVLCAIAGAAYDRGDLDKAIATSIEALRLCHGDNMGQRYLLSTMLLDAGRYADALSFCQTWMDERYDGMNRPLGGCVFQSPRSEPLDEREFGRLKGGWVSAALQLDAAYAAFKLWGDCELARQYLRLGTESNPLIFAKMLAMYKNPSKRRTEARVQNGTEDAHDYRWQAQRLWLEPDAWAWLSTSKDVEAIVTKTCAREGCGEREGWPLEFKQCSACKRVCYCGRECQKADWPVHKPVHQVCQGREQDYDFRRTHQHPEGLGGPALQDDGVDVYDGFHGFSGAW
ncbi:hypothetical protein C8Q78DRAFT_1065590 [Trametes maxima]|nr:hypothetical protein C8Q78DRAFT_1065590 [Trametes maxima]